MSNNSTKAAEVPQQAAEPQAAPVAIVAGGGGAIGRATAIALAEAGYRLVLTGRTQQTLDETARRVAGDALCVCADLTLPRKAVHVVETAMKRFGRIDALVNSVGLAPILSIEQTTPEKWREIIDINLSAVFYLCRAAWPELKKAGRAAGSAIVNISSEASRDPFAGFSAYGAAKAGLNLLGLSLAREGAAHGVRVHTIAPAAVETAMFRGIMSAQDYPPDKTLDAAEVARVIIACVVGELQHSSGEVIYLHKQVR